MALSILNWTAVVAISVLFSSYAFAAPANKDATILNLFSGKTAKASDKPAADTTAANALDLDGAVKQAQAQRKAGDLVGASKTLSQLVLAAPDDPRVLGEYGKTLVAQGRSDDALAFLECAIELQPSDWSLYSAQGVAFDQHGEYRQAQAAYDRALQMKPGEPTVLSNSALSHMQSGDLDGAERLLLQAAQGGGDFPRISSNLALVQSLKATRQAANPPAKTVAQVPAPAAAPVQAPSAPAPAKTAETKPSVVPAPQPVEQMALRAPEKPAATRDAAATSLKNNPSVVMQKVPVDPLAGPVAPRKTAAAKPPVAKKTVADATGKPAAEVSLLRPALDGEH